MTKEICVYCGAEEATHSEAGTGNPIGPRCRSSRSQTLSRNGRSGGAGIG